jgi:2-dehydropantoate 2-reductase
MRVAIVGAGAVGGYYGARLAQAGHDVTVIARGANLEAIRAHGLRVRSAAGGFAVKVCAESEPARVGHVGVPVAADVRAQKLRYLDASPPTMRSSMMVDITSGRPVELEALMGTVVRRGLAAGIPTPVMTTIYGILKPFEHGAPQL